MADRWAPGAALLSALAGFGSCTTFELARDEFDAVTRRDDAAAEPERLSYDFQPRRYPWLVRSLNGLGLDGVLAATLEVEPEPTKVDNPAKLVRDCLHVLAASAGRDLERIGEAAVRELWIVQVGSDQPLNQIVALQGMSGHLADLAVDPLQTPVPDPGGTSATEVAAWLETLSAHWPQARGGAQPAAAERAAYLEALAALTEAPLPDGVEQRALIGALVRGVRREGDAELRAATRAALRRALVHGLSLGLRGALYAESPRVREAAIVGLRRLAGPPAVGYVLARLAKPPAMLVADSNRFDDDRLLRLKLVRMCAQLAPKDALEAVAGGVPPVEFLYETAVGDQDANLRMVALDALARCLQRPLSFDLAWAERWWQDEYVPGGQRGSG